VIDGDIACAVGHREEVAIAAPHLAVDVVEQVVPNQDPRASAIVSPGDALSMACWRLAPSATVMVAATAGGPAIRRAAHASMPVEEFASSTQGYRRGDVTQQVCARFAELGNG
jgi:hypothetical protein